MMLSSKVGVWLGGGKRILGDEVVLYYAAGELPPAPAASALPPSALVTSKSYPVFTSAWRAELRIVFTHAFYLAGHHKYNFASHNAKTPESHKYLYVISQGISILTNAREAPSCAVRFRSLHNPTKTFVYARDIHTHADFNTLELREQKTPGHASHSWQPYAENCSRSARRVLPPLMT